MGVQCISWIGRLSYCNHSYYIIHDSHVHILHSKVSIHSQLWRFKIPPPSIDHLTLNNKFSMYQYHMFNDDSMHYLFLSLYLFGIPNDLRPCTPTLLASKLNVNQPIYIPDIYIYTHTCIQSFIYVYEYIYIYLPPISVFFWKSHSHVLSFQHVILQQALRQDFSTRGSWKRSTFLWKEHLNLESQICG